MFKQLLGKLPRRSSSSKPDPPDPLPPNSTVTTTPPPPLSSTKPTAVKRTSSAVFPTSVVSGIEPLLSFKDVPNSEKMNLFLSKLNLCCTTFDDFHDCNNQSHPTKPNPDKDIKLQTLLELIDFVTSGPPTKFPEPVIFAMCRMSSINLFRPFSNHNKASSASGLDVDDDNNEPTFDPSWSHLQLVYDLLLKFITSSSLDPKLAKKYIDHAFITRLLDLFDSEDPRERECLKTIVHRVYGKFMVHRPFVRKAMSNVFYRFVFETERHNGIAELLEIFGSVISGFALPLKEEHKMFLCRVLIPLHKPKMLGVYFQQLSYCVTQFIEKDSKLAGSVIRGLLKYWPITNSQKEVMFLGELEEILEGCDLLEFQKVMVPLFWRIGCCINSYHFQVAERALFLWNNDQIFNLIGHNRHVILPIILPALERNAQGHWNHAVLNLTMNVRKMFLEMDEPLYQDTLDRYQEDELRLVSLNEQRRAAWEHLEKAANLKSVVAGNIAVMVTTPPPPAPTATSINAC